MVFTIGLYSLKQATGVWVLRFRRRDGVSFLQERKRVLITNETGSDWMVEGESSTETNILGSSTHTTGIGSGKEHKEGSE